MFYFPQIIFAAVVLEKLSLTHHQRTELTDRPFSSALANIVISLDDRDNWQSSKTWWYLRKKWVHDDDGDFVVVCAAGIVHKYR